MILIVALILSLIVIGFVSMYPVTRWDRAQHLRSWGYGFDKKVTLPRLMHGPYVTDCSGFVDYVLGKDYRNASWKIMSNAETTLHLNYDFKDGSLIAYCSGATKFNKGRINGINHIMVVLEHEGNLYLCDCHKPVGVRIRPLIPSIDELNDYAKRRGFGGDFRGTHAMLRKQFFVKR
jgi:hypothetical protein